MSRRGRRNWSNLEINKRICKQLILHRVWNKLSQSDLAKDIGTTFQQYQKVEKCYNRIFAEQLVSICKNRGWKTEVLCEADPEETLKEWIDSDYVRRDEKGNVIESASEHYPMPDKVVKIRRCWEVLGKSAARHYYGEEPTPFVVDSIQKGN